jgi:YbgC/YbaW family acyl-CoA thioester hydrolase
VKAFTTQMQVRFGHVDPAGIAYFPRIFDYVHEAFEELWEEHVGVRYDHLLLERKLGFPLVHSEVDFTKPLHFGDRPIVRVTCFRLGRASLGLHYRYTTDDEPCVDARMVTACTHLPTMKSVPIPDEFRARFELIMETP